MWKLNFVGIEASLTVKREKKITEDWRTGGQGRAGIVQGARR